MSSFYYSPTVHSVTDSFTNYSTGGNKYVVNEQSLNQFKMDTDAAFRQISAAITSTQMELDKLKESNQRALERNQAQMQTIGWIGEHFPEALEAFTKTMLVTKKFDEADNQITWDSVEVQAGP